jgi:hypothetical protein
MHRSGAMGGADVSSSGTIDFIDTQGVAVTDVHCALLIQA